MMKDEIKQMRDLLDRMEENTNSPVDKAFKEIFDLFELPSLISGIVDYLQPSLHPYEAAIYWYMFRHSIVATGDVFLRVSVRGLSTRVITSSSGQSNKLSYSAVQTALSGLESKGAIQKVGDTNRDGTPYRILLPEEIKLCQDRMAVYQQNQVPKIDTEKELDYYNIAENRLKIFERDSYKCHYCGKQLTRFSATLDHLQPVSQKGDNSYNNLVTACLHCNSERGSRPIMDIIIKKE